MKYTNNIKEVLRQKKDKFFLHEYSANYDEEYGFFYEERCAM